MVTVDPAWEAALSRVGDARVVLVAGGTDTGKTTFAAWLAGRLLERGLSVGVVDADLGQSDVGPPGTVGLGRLAAPTGRLGDAELLGLAFVGAASPEGHLLPTVLGTRAMTDRAFELGLDRVVVDTSGLVQGEVGRLLKQGKIDLVAPEAVVCLQRADEAEHVLRPYGNGPGPLVVRLRAPAAARRRSAEERRLHRERSLREYLVSARPVTLDLDRVALRQPALRVGLALPPREADELSALLGEAVCWAERRAGELLVVTPEPLGPASLARLRERHEGLAVAAHWLEALQGVVAGLDDLRRETVGLGVVRSLDLAKGRLVVETPVAEDAIAAVRLGVLRAP